MELETIMIINGRECATKLCEMMGDTMGIHAVVVKGAEGRANGNRPWLMSTHVRRRNETQEAKSKSI